MLLFKVSPLFLLLFCFLGSFVQSQETSSSLSDQIDSLIGEFNKSLDELLHDLKDFGDIVGECFEANLTTSEGREHRLDISNRSLNFKSIVSEYYVMNYWFFVYDLIINLYLHKGSLPRQKRHPSWYHKPARLYPRHDISLLNS